ncbi:MAG: rhomboid family intramembrane serine protease [Marinilabiliaceae bacterium]|nr:rhomboid family intramembrane serine protease [Marinilabiliaceae bacterium]
MTPIVKNLLIINVLIFLAQKAFANTLNITGLFALHYPASESFFSFQLITYMFLHADFGHIFFNMFAVFMFGTLLEKVWGSKRFLTYYLVTGIGAGLIQYLVAYLSIKNLESQLTFEEIRIIYSHNYSALNNLANVNVPIVKELIATINTPTIGASGAVFGILLAFGMLFPNTQLMLLFPPIPIRAKYFVIIYGVMELFMGVASRPGDNVAHWAHLGGMLFGFFMIRYWRKKGIY